MWTVYLQCQLLRTMNLLCICSHPLSTISTQLDDGCRPSKMQFQLQIEILSFDFGNVLQSEPPLKRFHTLSNSRNPMDESTLSVSSSNFFNTSLDPLKLPRRHGTSPDPGRSPPEDTIRRTASLGTRSDGPGAPPSVIVVVRTGIPDGRRLAHTGDGVLYSRLSAMLKDPKEG
jgi:hypothetical protein